MSEAVEVLKPNYDVFKDVDMVRSLEVLRFNKFKANQTVLKSDKRIKKEKMNLDIKKGELRIKTDFKAEGITNDKGRESYINKVLKEDIDHLELLEEENRWFKIGLNDALDELTDYRLLIRLEISRREMLE